MFKKAGNPLRWRRGGCEADGVVKIIKKSQIF